MTLAAHTPTIAISPRRGDAVRRARMHDLSAQNGLDGRLAPFSAHPRAGSGPNPCRAASGAERRSECAKPITMHIRPHLRKSAAIDREGLASLGTAAIVARDREVAP
jgi:hypothetical protein